MAYSQTQLSEISERVVRRSPFYGILLNLVFLLVTPLAFGQITIQVKDSTSAVLENVEITYTLSNGKTRFEMTGNNGQLVISPEVESKFITVRQITKVGYHTLLPAKKIEAGQTKVFVLKLNPEELKETVVTVQYSKRSATQAVEKVQVIDRNEIDQIAAVNLKDVLQNQLNVRISQDNSTGTVLSLMGVSGNNVKILVDGVPVIGRLDGNIDLSQLNLNDIERIEVVEGPMSVSYGSNALAGVINLITKKGSDKSIGNLNGYYESVGYYNVDGSINAGLGKTNLRLSGGRYFFGGWSDRDLGRFEQWKPKEQYFGRMQLSRTFGKATIRLKSEGFRELLLNKGIPLPPYYETAFDEEFYTYRLDQGLFVDYAINKNSSFQAIGSYNYFYRRRDKYFHDLVNLERNLTSASGDQDTSIFKALTLRGTYNNFRNSSRIHYQLGYDIRTETGHGIRLQRSVGRGEDPMIADYALFGSLEWKVTSKWVIKPGIRAAYNSRYDAPLVPMVAARYKGKNLTGRISYSRGFRAPELKELYLSFVDVNHNILGNPDLNAEYSHNFIASMQKMFLLKSKKEAQFRALKLELSGFYNTIHDRITLANTTGNIYTYVNIEDFQTLGTNFALNSRLGKYQGQFAGSYIGLSNDKGEAEAGAPAFNFYPEFRFRGRYQFEKFGINAVYKYNGRQTIWAVDPETSDLSQRQLEGYGLLDVNVTGTIWNKKVLWSLGVKNILDVTYISQQVASGAHTSGATQQPIGTGRSYFVRLTYNIMKK